MIAGACWRSNRVLPKDVASAGQERIFVSRLPIWSSFPKEARRRLVTEALIEADDELGHSKIIGNTGVKIASIPGGLCTPLSLEAQMISWEGDDGDDANSENTGDVAVMVHAFEMRRDARSFVRHIRELRQSVGPSKLIYAPGITSSFTSGECIRYNGTTFDSITCGGGGAGVVVTVPGDAASTLATLDLQGLTQSLGAVA